MKGQYDIFISYRRIDSEGRTSGRDIARTLIELYSLNPTPPRLGSYNFSNNEYLHTNVYVLQEALEAYQNADPWKNFWNLQFLEPTAIKATEAGNSAGIEANTPAYDLNGNRVEDWQSKKGVYIVDGKKVAVK